MVEKFLKYFVSERYVLELQIDKHKKTIVGSVKVFGEILSDVIKFHAVRLKISDVTVDGENVKFENDKVIIEGDITSGNCYLVFE